MSKRVIISVLSIIVLLIAFIAISLFMGYGLNAEKAAIEERAESLDVGTFFDSLSATYDPTGTFKNKNSIYVSALLADEVGTRFLPPNPLAGVSKVEFGADKDFCILRAYDADGNLLYIYDFIAQKYAWKKPGLPANLPNPLPLDIINLLANTQLPSLGALKFTNNDAVVTDGQIVLMDGDAARITLSTKTFNIGGIECVRLQLISPEGLSFDFFIDPATMLVKMKRFHARGENGAPSYTETSFYEYDKMADGTPFVVKETLTITDDKDPRKVLTRSTVKTQKYSLSEKPGAAMLKP